MHYLVFAIVDKPTSEAIDEVMRGHENEHWDYWLPGGRWDGYLAGEAEMEKRAKFPHSSPKIEANCCLVRGLPADDEPWAFVCDRYYVPKAHYDPFAPKQDAIDKDGHASLMAYGDRVPTPNWKERWEATKAANPDKYVVVLDVHN